MATIRRPRPLIRAGFLIAIAALVSFGAVLTTPRVVVACSCVGFASLKEAVGPESALFTGTAGKRQERGVPVEIQRWFWGRGSAPIVWLSGDSFGDGAACGINEPPPGSSWLWLASPADDGTFGTGICSPSWRLDTPEGQAMLAEAVTLFGPDSEVEPATPVPTSDAPLPTAEPGPADVARDRTAVTILIALLLGSAALFGGLLIVARRSSRGDRR
jgi:hypothetical protein